jgi:uncharacterized low-complexity protein
MTKLNKSLTLAVGGAFALTVGSTSFAADENPFAIKSLSSGYQVADVDMKKMKDGKSGANKKKMMEKMSADGKCSADKMKDGGCSAEMKASMAKSDASVKSKDGKCSTEKAKEGSCHTEKK